MGRSDKDTFVALLRDLARQIQSLDESDFANVMTGKAKLKLEIRGGRLSPRKRARRLSGKEVRELADTLRRLKKREEGERLLDGKALTKDGLTQLARHLDLSVQKSDSVEHLRSKIIESTIGFRLRSAAVQGSVDGT